MYSMVGSHGGGSSSSSKPSNRPRGQGSGLSAGPSCSRQHSQQHLHPTSGGGAAGSGPPGGGQGGGGEIGEVEIEGVQRGLHRRLFAYIKQYVTGVKFRKGETVFCTIIFFPYSTVRLYIPSRYLNTAKSENLINRSQ